jgi:hypothetical protein
MPSRATSREENQRLFRLGNERLHVAVADQVPGSGRVPFLCECADEFCNARVELPLVVWESVAREENHFVTLRGHMRSEGERVVGTLEGYEIVRKP